MAFAISTYTFIFKVLNKNEIVHLNAKSNSSITAMHLKYDLRPEKIGLMAIWVAPSFPERHSVFDV